MNDILNTIHEQEVLLLKERKPVQFNDIAAMGTGKTDLGGSSLN